MLKIVVTMSLNADLQKFLSRKNIIPELLTHAYNSSLTVSADLLSLEHHKIARAAIIACGDEHMMVIVPLNAVIDFSAIEALTHKKFKPVSSASFQHLFSATEAGCLMPFPEAYSLKGVVDQSLSGFDEIYLEAGNHTDFLKIKNVQFQQLMQECTAAEISIIIQADNEKLLTGKETFWNKIQLPGNDYIKRRMNQLHRLPAMPAVAVKILKVVADPEAKIADLASLIEIDPSMAAQVMRYARSSYFGYQGKVDSIQKAISRVLGFDVVANLALGIAAGRAFNLNSDGPLGINSFWKNAVFAAALSQKLARKSSLESINSGTAYLVGLLHNFGVLVLAELFQSEYYLLNKLITSFPYCSLYDLEQQLIKSSATGDKEAKQSMDSGEEPMLISHNSLGQWLMKYWNMPEAIVVANAEHHNPHYQGDEADYVILLRVVLNLLSSQGLGDLGDEEIDESCFQHLGITRQDGMQQLDLLLENSTELEKIATLIGENRV
ncbi:MAG TPA: HDOD domain-containing protein [Aeromonadales bacterium]|nr:HDOD domain-containing protein [Aeromonadales bacterium]